MAQAVGVVLVALICKEAVEKRPSAAFPSAFVAAMYYKYASLLRLSGALHTDIFEQPHDGGSF